MLIKDLLYGFKSHYQLIIVVIHFHVGDAMAYRVYSSSLVCKILQSRFFFFLINRFFQSCHGEVSMKLDALVFEFFLKNLTVNLFVLSNAYMLVCCDKTKIMFAKKPEYDMDHILTAF